MFKKLLTLLLVLALVIPGLLTACSNQGAPEDPTSESASDTESASGSETESDEEKPTETEKTGNIYQRTNILMVTDVHLCHLDWYGMSSPDRMEKMIEDLNEYRENYGYKAILFLGDYSLDFWETGILGSWRHKEISNTANFLNDYADNLDCKDWYIIPGNHEQYGYELWKDITGFDRQYYLKIGGYLIFMLDNFHGDLDPDTDNHGVYTPTDLDFIQEVMDENPDMPVILCAHYFDIAKEEAEGTGFRDLVCDDRVVALFCGHDHVRTVQNLGPNYANKIIFHCGQYSYTKSTITQCPWGWRPVELSEEGITVEYYAPQSTVVDGGKTIEIDEDFLEEIFVPNLLTNPIEKESDEAGESVEFPDLTGLSNLCEGATVVQASPGNKEKNGPQSLIDQDKEQTKWCVTSDPNLPDELKSSALYYAVLDLGETYELSAYILYGASQSSYSGDSGNQAMDMKAWKLQASTDGSSWKDLDTVNDNTASVYQAGISANARYIRLLILPGGANQSDNTLRLYELEIYGKK
ncbi:MAG: discoidin domain-containing protein [Clostridia bacterium]|nr:discoidin domain-containing protein [Clostridia bacterium]